MKILQINSHYRKGGAGKIVSYLHQDFQKRGISSYVAYGRERNVNEENVFFIGNKFETYLEAIVTRVLGINGYTSLYSTWKLIRLIKKLNPDIIHLHVIHGYYLNFNMLFSYLNKQKTPVVWTFHDCHAFTGNCGYYYDCQKWENGCHDCEYLRDYPKSNFFDFTKKMWRDKKAVFIKTKKIIISPSDWMTNDAKMSYFGKYKCVTINNGIDTEKTFFPKDRSSLRSKYGYKDSDRVLLGISFGQENPRKGVKYLIQLANDLSSQGVKLILIGWNKKYDELISGLDNVTTIPFTSDQNELADYYSLADIFLLPSLAENYATVVIESLACGTPVVGFDVGGVAEQLKDGKGIAVQLKAQQEFNNAILDILENKVSLKSKDQIAKFTKKNNSIKTMVDKYLEAYTELLENSMEE